MRTTSFVSPARARPVRLGLLVWVLAVVFFGIAGWAFVQARQVQDSAEQLRAHAVRMGQRLSELGTASESIPSEAAFRELTERVRRLNTLVGDRSAALLVVLTALEEALPPVVWVGQMTYSAETGAFAVSLLGESETVLPQALQRIEDLEILTDVILERQVRIQSGARTLLQYDIRATAR